MMQFPKWNHTTLPSVEDWGTNMNILRDPPKSITTRKIDKVGMNANLTQEIDDSGDRAGEFIRVYARGVNPMVSVSYNNNGGNAYGAGNVGGSSRAQAFLPYRVAVDGAFRAPVMTGRDLLALSRQPRNWTSSFTMPTFADYSKKMMCPDKLKEVKDAIQHVSVRPNEVYNIRTPLKETYDVKYNIVDRVKVSGDSGKKVGDVSMRVNHENIGEVHEDTLRVTGSTNKSAPNRTSHHTEISFNTSKYLQEGHYSHVNTQHKYNEKTLILDEVELERKMPTYSMEANKNDNRIFKKVEHENEIQLERNRPMTSMVVNAAVNQGVDNISSRSAYLRPKVNPGGFEGGGFQPTFSGDRQDATLLHQEKPTLNKQAYTFFQDRYQN